VEEDQAYKPMQGKQVEAWLAAVMYKHWWLCAVYLWLTHYQNSSII